MREPRRASPTSVGDFSRAHNRDRWAQQQRDVTPAVDGFVLRAVAQQVKLPVFECSSGLANQLLQQPWENCLGHGIVRAVIAPLLHREGCRGRSVTALPIAHIYS